MAGSKIPLTQSYLKECLSYDPLTGVFTWKRRPLSHFKNSRAQAVWNAKYAHTRAGTSRLEGYIFISINKRIFRAHRLAFLYMKGRWPKNDVDHWKGMSNRWENLREATRTQNNGNRKSTAQSGLKGAYLHKKFGGWHSQIQVHGQNIYLGRFKTAEEAHAAYVAAAKKHFGEFARAV